MSASGRRIVPAAVLCALALVAAARGLIRHNTWYLASDQFAFLTFADDLARGRVLHDPATVALLAGPALPRGAAADAYYQTYVWRDGRLYSRYPPGYPALLAAAKVLAGEPAEHWLNPLLYLVLLAAVGGLAWRLADGGLGSAAAAVATWGLLVVPAEVHYWGITVARDLPAHLLAIAALLAACAGRAATAGLALGLAASIRPDAVLWGVSVGPVLAATKPARRTVVAGTVAFVAGALPLFAYNTFTQGHPLAFTQGSEFRGLFTSALGTLGAAPDFRSGGAFRLAHFPATFAAHLRYLAGAFGALLVLAVGTLVVAARRGRILARALAPYTVVGLAFYSCWGHGDARYLVGVCLCLIVALACGAVALASRLGDPGRSWRSTLVLVAVVVATVALFASAPPRDAASGLAGLEWATALGFAGAAMTRFVPPLRPFAALAPAFAFAALGGARIVASTSAPDAFQAAQIARARVALEAVVPAHALVLTSPGLGRPAENIAHYTHADAHYLGELPGLLSTVDVVARRCAEAGRPLYFLLDASEAAPAGAGWSSREVARRDGDALRDWFVDPHRAPIGVVLYLATGPPTPPGR